MGSRAFLYRYAGFGSFLAMLTNAAAIFAVFRIGYTELGPAIVGMWALIQGIMFLSRIADSGSGGNLTRLVAIDRARQGSVRLKNFILAGLLVGTGPIVILGGGIFLPALYYLRANYTGIVDTAAILGLLSSSLAFGILMSVAMLVSSCLDGLGLMALRGYLSCLANLLFIPISLIFVRLMGGVGFGVAYVVYALMFGVILLVGLVIFHPPMAPSYAEQSVSELSRKTIRFNLTFVFTSLCQLLLDPTCKILIGRFGTLDTVAIFDLANKVASQARILFQAALQSVLPMLSRETPGIESETHKKLLHWNLVVARWSFTAMALIILNSGYVSLFSLGNVNEQFIRLLLVLSMGNAINAIGLVGYYADLGGGHLRRIARIFAGAAVGNLTMGLALGYIFGEIGVAISLAFNIAWSGLGFSQAVFGRYNDIGLSLAFQIAPELILFASASLITWVVMVGIPDATLMLRVASTSAMSMIVMLLFMYRERERIQHYGHRFISAMSRTRSD